MSVTYMLAADAAIVLDYMGTNEAVVKGLNKLSLPGGVREVVTVDEFRNEWARQFTTSGKYNDITFGGQFTVGDTKGQDALRDGWLTRKKYVGTELMCFLNQDDFFTTDLANDPESGLQVAEVSSGETDKNGIFPLNGRLVPNGRLAIYTAHLIEDAIPTLAFTTSGSKKVTDSGNRFVTSGFVEGMTLLISGSTSNDGVAALITSVAAGELVLDVKVGTLTAESGAANMELHGGRF